MGQQTTHDGYNKVTALLRRHKQLCAVLAEQKSRPLGHIRRRPSTQTLASTLCDFGQHTLISLITRCVTLTG